MLFALVYRLLRRMVRLVAGSSNELDIDVEVVVLRHQLSELKRQVGRPRLPPRPAVHGRVGGALPRARWSAFVVSPQTPFAGTGSWYDGSGTSVGYQREAYHPSPARFETSSCGWGGRTPVGVHPDPGRARQARHQGLRDQDPDAAASGRPRSGPPTRRPHRERVSAYPGRRHARAGLLHCGDSLASDALRALRDSHRDASGDDSRRHQEPRLGVGHPARPRPDGGGATFEASGS